MSNAEFRMPNPESRMPHALPGRNSAFTITEMLVSLAIIMFIMAIVSEAFVAGLDSFRQMKAVGDLDQRLRAATILLRNDLMADHFNQPPMKVSNITLNPPPKQGYFHVQDPGSVPEGADGDGIPSVRSGTPPLLAFTVNWSKGSGDKQDPHLMRRQNYLAAFCPPLASLTPPQYYDVPAPGQNYLSQTAEVAYFLTPNNASTPGGTPLFSLHRRQCLLLTPEGAERVAGQTGTPSVHYDISYGPSGKFNTLEDVASQASRSVLLATPLTAPNNVGTDIILTDVLSFTVRLMPSGTNTFVDLSYDTAAPGGSLIRAVEITLRVWDVKTSTTRQITVVQDL